MAKLSTRAFLDARQLARDGNSGERDGAWRNRAQRTLDRHNLNDDDRRMFKRIAEDRGWS